MSKVFFQFTLNSRTSEKFLSEQWIDIRFTPETIEFLAVASSLRFVTLVALPAALTEQTVLVLVDCVGHAPFLRALPDFGPCPASGEFPG